MGGSDGSSRTLSWAAARWKRLRDTSPFGSHVLLTVATNVVMALLSLLTGMLLARLLGPGGRGELAAIQVWPTAIATFATLGLAEATIYFSARFPARAGVYFTSALSLGLLISIPFLIGSWLATPYVLAAQTAAIVAATRWYLVIIPLVVIQGMLLHPLRGRSDLVPWNLLRLSPTIGWFLIVVVARWQHRASAEPLAWTYLALLALLLLPMAWVLRVRVPGPYACEPAEWRPMLKYGVPSAAGLVPQWLNLRLDQIIIAAFLPAQLLGLYAVAATWGNAALPLLTGIGAVLFPRVASRDSPANRAAALGQGVRLAMSVALVLWVVLCAAAPFAIPRLFGLSFQAAIVPAMVLTIAGSLAGINIVLEEGMRGLGSPQSVFWSEATGLLVTAGSLLLLVPRWRITGAAVASTLGAATTCLVLLVSGRVKSGTGFAALYVPTRSDWKLLRRRVTALVNSQT